MSLSLYHPAVLQRETSLCLFVRCSSPGMDLCASEGTMEMLQPMGTPHAAPEPAPTPPESRVITIALHRVFLHLSPSFSKCLSSHYYPQVRKGHCQPWECPEHQGKGSKACPASMTGVLCLFPFKCVLCDVLTRCVFSVVLWFAEKQLCSYERGSSELGQPGQGELIKLL